MTSSTRGENHNVLLLSCYEMGHQPINLAWPAAALDKAGLTVQTCDLSIEDFPTQAIASADLIAISVPMHTALRLGVEAANHIRSTNPSAHICFYGLYAYLNREFLLAGLANSIIAGEPEQSLVQLAQSISKSLPVENVAGVHTIASNSRPYLPRPTLPIPARTELPSLDNYAKYDDGTIQSLAGYTESTRGCLHTCNHCPVVPIYNGRFFAIPIKDVLADIRQQVLAGANHITFGDPDFLNGPGHALKIAKALHQEFPQLTFDFTTKVEHIIQHRQHIPQFAAYGCTIITSAFESTQQHILDRLDKGHNLEDMHTSIDILRAANIALQSTWMPFTPWTSLTDYLHLLSWVRAHDLIPQVPIVQLSIRMLVPPHSALLNHEDTTDWLGELDQENFTYEWTHPDERMDQLHVEVAALAESTAGQDPYSTFRQVEALASKYAGVSLPKYPTHNNMQAPAPQLTEHWFC